MFKEMFPLSDLFRSLVDNKKKNSKCKSIIKKIQNEVIHAYNKNNEKFIDNFIKYTLVSSYGSLLIDHGLSKILDDLIEYFKKQTNEKLRWEVVKLRCYQDYEQMIIDHDYSIVDISPYRKPKEEILFDYKKLIKNNPHDEQLLFYAVNYNVECNKYVDAIKLQNKLVKISPKINYLVRARIYFDSIKNKTGKTSLPKAEILGLKDIEKALNLDPKNYAPYEERGDFYEYKREFDLALKDYDKALTLINENDVKSRIMVKKGEIYSRHLKQHDKAIELFTSAIKINSAFEHLYSRAKAYFWNSQFDMAIEDLLKYNNSYCRNDESYALLARCYGKIEEYENEIKYYKLADEYSEKHHNFTQYKTEVEWAYEALVGKLKKQKKETKVIEEEITQDVLDKYFFKILSNCRANYEIIQSTQILLNLIFLKRIIENHKRIPYLNSEKIDLKITWDELIESKDIKLSLSNALNEMKNLFSPNLDDVFDEFKLDEINDDITRDLCQGLSQIKFDNRIQNDVMGLSFQNLIENSFHGHGFKYSEKTTPKIIKQLMVKLLDINPGDSIYDPAMGVGGFALEINLKLSPFYKRMNEIGEENRFDNWSFQGQEINKNTYRICKMNLIISGLNNFSVINQDSLIMPNFSSNRKRKCDKAISNFPFNMRLSNEQIHRYPYSFKSENEIEKKFEHNDENKIITKLSNKLSPNHGNISFIDLMFSSLNKDGKMVVVVPEGFAFRSSSLEKAYREFLIRKDLIETIVSVPSNAFESTHISSLIILFNKNKSKSQKDLIKFVNISDTSFKRRSSKDSSKIEWLDNVLKLIYYNRESNYVRNIQLKDIEKNNFKILPNYYFSMFDSSNAPIKLDASKNQIKKFSELVTEVKNQINTKLVDYSGPTIKIRDMPSTLIATSINPNNLESIDLKKQKNWISGYKNYLLVSLLGDNLKPTIFNPHGDNIGLYNNIAVYTINEKLILPDYLRNILYNKDTQRQLKGIRSGNFIVGISKSNLNNIQLIVPTIEEQTKILNESKEHLYKVELEKLERKIGLERRKSEDKEWEIVKNVAHNFRSNIGNIKNVLSSIEEYLEKRDILNELMVNIDGDVPYSKNLTLKRQFELLFENLDDGTELVNNSMDVGSINRNDLKFENKNINLFIKHRLEVFFVGQKNINYKVVSKQSDKNIYMDIDILSFKDIIDNLMKNAVNHAFDNSIINPEVNFSIYEDELIDSNNVVIEYENNGKKFNEGFNTDKFKQMLSSKGGKNKGIGGTKISRWIDAYNGFIEIGNTESGVIFTISLPKRQDKVNG